jgi:dipeptidyl aminopeptidase/acylaminoacyl peptidase
VSLTPKAFDTLVLLVDRRDRVVSKRELFDELWPDTAVEEATLSQHIFMVRRALSDSGSADARYVATVARRGYRFVGPVTPLDSPDGARVDGNRPVAVRYARWTFGALVALGVVATAVVTWNLRATVAELQVVRLAIPVPAGQRLSGQARGAPALSSDGGSIVYAANGRLYLRRMNDDDAQPIPGTDLDVRMPFFSPDGRWVGFWSARDSTLKKVGINGGAPVTLGPASNPRGASWFADRIVFAEGGEGVVTLPSSGGARVLWTAPDRDEMLQAPQLLPGAEAVLFTAATVTGNRTIRTDVVAYSRTTRARTLVIPQARAARSVGANVIVYAIGTALYAAPFDPRRLEVVGDPVPIARDVNAAANFDVAPDGTLIYVRGGDAASQPQRWLALVDAGGAAHVVGVPLSSYETPRISPDGRRLAFATDDDDGTIWVCDIAGKPRPQRLTFQGHMRSPVWSPDGRFIAYGSTRSGQVGIFVLPADGVGLAERVTEAQPGFEHVPESWSSDGSVLAFTNVKAGIKDTIWTVALTGSHRPDQILAVHGSNQMDPRLSPDRRWIAYASEGEAGDSTLQVYVQPFPVTGAKVQISPNGGDMPAWSADGTRLFYHTRSQALMSVRVRTRPSLSFEEPVVVADDLLSDGGYDVTPDGRFVAALDRRGPEGASPRSLEQINVVLNWFVEMKRAVATGERRPAWRVSRRIVPVSVSSSIDR